MMQAGWWAKDLYDSGGAVPVICQVFWVVFSICMHELAHGWAALWQGDQTPRRLGHMTLNPMIHMGPMSLIMFAATGFAWGLMPVDPSRFRWRRKGRVVVSGAGPAMNIAMGIIALTALAFWETYGPARQPLHDNVSSFLGLGGSLNFALAMFNMLPVPPLDGADVLMGFSMRAYRFYQSPQVQQASIVIIILVFATGMGAVFYLVADVLAAIYVGVLMGILP